MHSILHEHLAAKKICSRWIPHNLTKAQKEACAKLYKEMLKKKIKLGTAESVFNIATGDKTWLHSNEP